MTENEIEFLQQENDRLKNELSEMKAKMQGVHEDYKKQLSVARKDQAVTLLLAGFKTEFDDLPAGVKDSALKEIINNRLAADAAELTIDEGGRLILRRKDGTNFFGADHRLLDPKSYLEKMMTTDKILKANDLSSGNNTSGNRTGQQPDQTRPYNNGRGSSKSRNVLSDLANESLQALTAE